MARTSWPERFDILETPMERMPWDILYPFAWDELVCRQVGEGVRCPIVHIWRHPEALVLGLRDRRLPGAPNVMEQLRLAGVSVGVRNSGGAAVPLDSGVVNVSVVLPNPERRLEFHSDFQFMAELIRESLQDWTDTSRAGEITGAYCPGEYDISIGGRKFCGIAQRRQTRAYVVSAFVVVSGKGSEQGERVRSFYEKAALGASEGFPEVRPSVMASLEELAGVPSPEAYMDSLKRLLIGKGGTLIEPYRPVVPEVEARTMMEQLRARYDK